MLKPLGSQIFFATSGAMALDIAKKAQPDLILLDIMMPDMDGLETCRWLKATKGLEAIPVIFVTAKTAVEDLVRGCWRIFWSGPAFRQGRNWTCSI